MSSEKPKNPGRFGLGGLLRKSSDGNTSEEDGKFKPPVWSMGILNDPETVEVPGSVLLLAADRNEPLGLRNVHARTSHSSIPTGFAVDHPSTPNGTRIPLSPRDSHDLGVSGSPSSAPTLRQTPSGANDEEKKKTADGQIILEPQPDESANDPLNWPSWRRDLALLSLGIYCMMGGGMTPLIAAGFTNVAADFNVSTEKVALTTGLYMMGLGLGSVVLSPTAILWGKRPVYLFSVLIFIGTSLWAGFSPNFNSLLVARIFQGVAVSPVECLPSATIAEIFFLHERAYRIGIYTLLLLGGKNLVPLVSAAVIGRFGWRWAFYITAMIVALCGVLLFFFVPETFWDRTPTRHHPKRPSLLQRLSYRTGRSSTYTIPRHQPAITIGTEKVDSGSADAHGPEMDVGTSSLGNHGTNAGQSGQAAQTSQSSHDPSETHHVVWADLPDPAAQPIAASRQDATSGSQEAAGQLLPETAAAAPQDVSMPTPQPVHLTGSSARDVPSESLSNTPVSYSTSNRVADTLPSDIEKAKPHGTSNLPVSQVYTHNLRQQPQRSFVQQLKPFSGRLNSDSWFKAMIRPFFLYAYPAVLWSSVVYACSIGWLIVISETLAVIYRDPHIYNFTALQTGLVYVSPFVGGILGTGVAGKISDIIVRSMAKKNGGMYEPEFRLVMVIPILVTTCVGLMGFGWSVEERDNWIVPTLFFGIISFGCSLGSTTSITFCVDSYRQYAGEALVTLNFSKNILHGLVWSLFVSKWLESDGPKSVYIWIGIIQLILLLLTIPMYIYGKRARMWTIRKNFVEKF